MASSLHSWGCSVPHSLSAEGQLLGFIAIAYERLGLMGKQNYSWSRPRLGKNAGLPGVEKVSMNNKNRLSGEPARIENTHSMAQRAALCI